MVQISKDSPVTTLNVTVLPGLKFRFADWQAKLNGTIVGFPGFVSLEFLTLPNQASSWAIVQRFNSTENLSKWHQSREYHDLMKELDSLIEQKGSKEKIEGESELKEGVTEVIIAEINPKKEQAYREWSSKIHQIEAKFEGFRGVYIQSPNQTQGRFWVTLLQFDSAKNLDRWLQSKERQEILEESKSLISSLETHRMASPYAGWFYSVAKTEGIPSV